MSIATIRAAIATAADGITGLRATDYVPDQINPPHAVVFNKGIDYDLVFGRGADEYGFTVRVYAGRVSERSSQAFLDTLCEPSGATSLKTVLEADAGLAALVDYVRVRRANDPQVTTVGAIDYLIVDFDMEAVL